MLPIKLKPEIFRPTAPPRSCSARRLAGAGLVRRASACRAPARAEARGRSPIPFNAYVTIAPDNTVTVLSAHIDMGQGSYHGLATLVAEELDADWTRCGSSRRRRQPEALRQPRLGRHRRAPAARRRCSRRSTATARPAPRPRHAGRRRGQAVERAGRRDHGREGRAPHASGKQATFGELRRRRRAVPVPAEVALKDAEGLEAHRQRRTAAASTAARNRPAQRSSHRREAARHADGGGRPSAAVRRHGQELRRQRRPRR